MIYKIAVNATCPAGTVLLGGGGRVVSTSGAASFLQAAFPQTSNSFTATGAGTATNSAFNVTAFAICTTP